MKPLVLAALSFALLFLALGVAGCTPSSTSSTPSKTSPEGPSATPRHVTFLHIADSHAQLETHPEYMPGQTPELQSMGGYARLKTAIDRERAASKGAVFVADGGDTFQGSGPAAWSEGEVVLGPLNALGLASASRETGRSCMDRSGFAT